MTLEEKIAALSALEKAYASGATRVRQGGEEVQYDSAQQMRARIDALKAEIAAAQGRSLPSRQHFPTFNRGV